MKINKVLLIPILLLSAMSKLSAMSCKSYRTSTQTAEFGYEKAFFFV